MKSGCLLSLLLTIGSRTVLLFVWLFAPWASLAFPNGLWPVLGFLFMPTTTVAYLFAWSPASGVTGLGWLILAGGLLFDIGSYAIGFRAGHTPIKVMELN